MSGEADLEVLLSRADPVRLPGAYVFAVVPAETVLPSDDVMASVREAEGFTVVVRQDVADRYGLGYDFVAAWITLEVHSALDAVGLTAAVSVALARQGISCNVIAGYYHDHLLVPVDRADDALDILRRGLRDTGTL